MPNQFPNEIGKPDVTDVASRGSTAEQELVAAAKRGDEDAFETLFNHHQRRIYVLAFRYTRIREDAEDIVQRLMSGSRVVKYALAAFRYLVTGIVAMLLGAASGLADRRAWGSHRCGP